MDIVNRDRLTHVILLNKVVILNRFEFYFVFRDFIVLLRRLVLCHLLVTTFCFSSSYCDILFVWEMKRVKHIRSNRDNKLYYGNHNVVELMSYVF